MISLITGRPSRALWSLSGSQWLDRHMPAALTAWHSYIHLLVHSFIPQIFIDSHSVQALCQSWTYYDMWNRYVFALRGRSFLEKADTNAWVIWFCNKGKKFTRSSDMVASWPVSLARLECYILQDSPSAMFPLGWVIGRFSQENWWMGREPAIIHSKIHVFLATQSNTSLSASVKGFHQHNIKFHISWFF